MVWIETPGLHDHLWIILGVEQNQKKTNGEVAGEFLKARSCPIPNSVIPSAAGRYGAYRAEIDRTWPISAATNVEQWLSPFRWLIFIARYAKWSLRSKCALPSVRIAELKTCSEGSHRCWRTPADNVESPA